MNCLKKVFLGVAALCLLASCGGNTQKAENAAEEADTVETAQPEAAEVETPDVVRELKAGEALTGTDRPVVVDFNATWCTPCLMFGPIFHEVAARYADDFEFVSVDVDSCKEIAGKYEISGIPQVIVLLPDGNIKKAPIGYLEESDFVTFLNSLKPKAE